MINLVLYHGVLAPHARWRSQAVRYGRPACDGNAREFEASPRAAAPTRAWTWPALMRRVFDLEVLSCPHCGGRLRVIATVLDPLAVRAILAQFAPSGPPARPRPTRPGPTLVVRASRPLSTLPLTSAAPPLPRFLIATPPGPDDSEPARDPSAHARLRPPRTAERALHGPVPGIAQSSREAAWTGRDVRRPSGGGFNRS